MSQALPAPQVPPASHLSSYPRFLWQAIKDATDGNLAFYAWMTALTAIALVGVNAWAHQVRDGLGLTGMSDHVSWGLYIANFTFMVGIAAGAVMMVIPGYLFHDRQMHDLVIIGELLAVAAMVACIAFVSVDIGRPDRLWHMLPGIGRFHWPMSMLTWDVIVLNGYLLLNLHVCGYLLYIRFLGRTPDPRWYVPFVMLSIVWAISIHTVTAFLYCGLGGRPFWNSALLAPRFLASAFVSGPALIVVVLLALRPLAGVPIGRGPLATLVAILRVTTLINLFMLSSEIFTELYTGGEHTMSARYLLFGLHGKTALVPWIWSAIALQVIGIALLYRKSVVTRPWHLAAACVAIFAAVWIEKGMGLIIPGFVPSTLHELVEYRPTEAEWRITAGIWALAGLIYTVGLKIALPILRRPHPMGGAG